MQVRATLLNGSCSVRLQPGGLAVRAQGQGFRVFGVELGDDLGPQHAGGAHLGDFHEMVHADGPEKRQPGGKVIDVHPGIDARPQVFEPVGQRVGQFQIGRGAGFLHMVTRYADGVEAGHVPRGIAEYVGDDPHGHFRRIDVGVAHHEFLQDVVLDGAAEFFQFCALFQGGHNIKGHDGKDGAVHGHGNRHLVERDLVEQDLHVEDGIDGHAGLAHVAHHPFVVGVVAAVGGQVEGHGKPFLPGCQVAAVKGIGFLGR